MGVGEVCLAANTAALVEGEFDEAMDPVLSVIRTARADGDECDDEDACACVHDHESACDCDDDDCACGHDHACDCDDDCGCGHDDDDCCDDALAVGVAIECGQLTPQVLCQAVDAISSAHPDYVVACTGAERCATPEDVRLVCATVEPGVAVRATTDARTVAEAVELFEAGAVELMCLHASQILLDFDRLATSL